MLSSDLRCVQTDATTPNIVGRTVLGVVASVLAVVCKRMQQLPTILGPAVHRGKDTTHKTLETMCHARTWPQQCSEELQLCKRIQHCCATLQRFTGQKKCWELLSQSFDRFQTLRYNAQQHATGCANERNM